MKKKGLLIISLAVIMSLASTFFSLAGEWKQDDIGWWWQEEGWYPTSCWMLINNKEYYFGADGYMLHDTVQDGFQLDNSGAKIIPDLGLEVAPYKAQLDTILLNNGYPYVQAVDLSNPAFGMGFYSENGFENWINCGDYYKVKNVVLYDWTYDELYGDETVDIGELDEIRIRKDGIFNFGGNSEQLETLLLEEWKKEGHGYPRFGVLFDDKGYVIRFRDTNAG